MRIRDWLIPQDKIFFELITKMFAKVVAASQVFSQAVRHNQFDHAVVLEIEKLENECDQHVHQIFDHLNQAFITPIDHEDIAHLTIACDDIIDFILVISSRLHIYNLNIANNNLQEFITIIEEMIKETFAIVTKTDKLKQNVLTSHAKAIHQFENQADTLLIKSLTEVFKEEDLKTLIKKKEIYEFLEVLTDNIEDFCDLVQGIVTKNL